LRVHIQFTIRFAVIAVFVPLLGCALPLASARAESHEASRNRASFQVEATREIANDWVTARLSVVSEGKDPAEVANAFNEAMARATKEATRVSEIEVRSGAFSVRRETRKALEDELIEEALESFRARASLIAKGMGSKDWSLIHVSVGGSDGVPHRVVELE
jgi:predicted secreted protein